MAKALTAAVLARELGLEADIALVTLWANGVECVEDVDQPIPVSWHKAARKALGGATPREMSRISYWMDAWSLDREATVNRLRDDFGIVVTAGARTLPTGALKRLRRDSLGLAGPTGSRSAPESAHEPKDLQEPFELKLPGRHKPAHVLDMDDVIAVHDALTEEFRISGDPIDPPGIRDVNLLQSAIHRPMTSLGDTLKYDTVEGCAAALLHSLVHNHPFFNGNKRTALVSMLVLLDRNGILLTCSQQTLFKHVLFVAQHKLVQRGATDFADREVQAIAEWIWTNSRQIEKGDRALTFRELRQILSRYDCTVSTPIPGNRIRIERTVSEKRGLLRRNVDVQLRHTTGYRNEGSEVGRRQLLELRRDLRLSEAHGYDAAYFYGADRREPDSFIAEYRSLLRRLGRL